jgi:hypothetical protein
LRSDTLQFIHKDRTNTVLAFKRWHEGGNIVVVVVNLSGIQWQEYDYGIDMGGEIGPWEEISIDVIAYAAQIAAQLGAHIIKVKLPTDLIEQQAAREVYEKMQIPLA